VSQAAALLVTPELIKADENLSIELWDSDRNTADDIVGKINTCTIHRLAILGEGQIYVWITAATLTPASILFTHRN
jgi:hypothetical protein